MILRVGVPNFDFYPKLMKNEETGEWSGVYIDFLEELKKKANFSYSFVINELTSFDDTGDKKNFFFYVFSSDRTKSFKAIIRLYI